MVRCCSICGCLGSKVKGIKIHCVENSELERKKLFLTTNCSMDQIKSLANIRGRKIFICQLHKLNKCNSIYVNEVGANIEIPMNQDAAVETTSTSPEPESTPTHFDHDYCVSSNSATRVQLELYQMKTACAKLKKEKIQLRHNLRRYQQSCSRYKKLYNQSVEDARKEKARALQMQMQFPVRKSCMFCTSARNFNDQQKQLAIDLYHTSREAYRFLRNHATLPNRRTIFRWLAATNAALGLTEVEEADHAQQNIVPDTLADQRVSFSPDEQSAIENDQEEARVAARNIAKMDGQFTEEVILNYE